MKATPFHFAVFAVLFSAASTQLDFEAAAQQKATFIRLDRVTASHALPNGIELRSGPAKEIEIE